jgi:hypothetical protein
MMLRYLVLVCISLPDSEFKYSKECLCIYPSSFMPLLLPLREEFALNNEE